jgi:hypothetical protein
MKYETKEYITHSGKSYYGDWFKKLAANIELAIELLKEYKKSILH